MSLAARKTWPSTTYPPSGLRGFWDLAYGTLLPAERVQGWFEWRFGFGVAVEDVGAVADSSSGAEASASAAALACSSRSAASSLARQQRLYFFPEPQWQGSLRPKRAGAMSAKGVDLRGSCSHWREEALCTRSSYLESPNRLLCRHTAPGYAG